MSGPVKKRAVQIGDNQSEGNSGSDVESGAEEAQKYTGQEVKYKPAGT